MTSHDLVMWATSRLYRKRDGIGQTPFSYERYLVFVYSCTFGIIISADDS